MIYRSIFAVRSIVRQTMALSFIAVILGTVFVGCCRCSTDDASTHEKISDDALPEPQIEFAPKQYICYRTDTPLQVDGKIDEDAWQQALWSDYFIDIEGESKPEPRFKTRAKMLWDENYFYIAGDMEESDVWGTLKRRDAVIFHDNDFEVFIDPDGDTHEYYELEVNALGAEWDLFLVKPYRDGGPAINAWDIQGLKSAINIDGTLNQPGDVDRGWSIEIAIPWEVLKQCAHKEAPPNDGDQWRVNFSRIEWKVKVENGQYIKMTDPETGKNLPEDNWVWSPQGLINMHYPEMWGYVQFSDKQAGSTKASFVFNSEEKIKWALRQLYYKQRTYMMQYGHFAKSLIQLGLSDAPIPGCTGPPQITRTSTLFEASLEKTDDGTRLYISQDGHTWRRGK
jgi:hypothetical protein